MPIRCKPDVFLHVSIVTLAAMLLFCGPRFASASQSVQDPDDGADQEFAQRLDKLQRVNPQKTDRKVIIQQCKTLINAYQDKPCTARAMMRIAALYGHTDRKSNWDAQHDVACEWYRRAARTAVSGSEEWLDAHFKISQWLRDRTDAERIEARELLESLYSYAPEDTYVRARLESEFLDQCLKEKDIDGAELHCRNLLKMSPDKVTVTRLQLPLRTMQSMAVRNVMFGVAWPGEPTAERTARIQKLAAEWKNVKDIKLWTEQSLKQVRD